ncbi:DUF5708 family protein [Streptomyces sp. I05A-00742]|uniref:DUF5708 family protein n=1 Tax=Streptomyces sp. I05A-00742 TaxID=2732853 RepID=UPI001488A1AE|nr:DUF5708 family protein [Streptomyces sp. I05A-00742]
MRRAHKNLLDGAVTFAIGLALKLFAADVSLRFFTPSKISVVLMCVGGVYLAVGAVQQVRGARGPG